MNDIFQIASIGLHEGQQRLEAISVNAASAALPGFRRHVMTSRAFDASLAALEISTAHAAAEPGASTLAQPRLSQLPAVQARAADRQAQQVDLHPGAVVATGRALDVAIDADELFFALTDGAQTWLTRAGALRLDDDGVLVGERGLRVVGTQGDVVLPGTDVTVEADGRITHEGLVVGQLQLFRSSDRESLLAGQGSLLTASGGMEPAEAGTWRVRGGALEASNTDATREMLGMMSLSRQFESLSRIVQHYDDALGRVIQKLGEG